MSKETNKDKGMLAIGAAITFCGLSLYAAERVLKYLFRDVDPDRTDITEVDEKDTADTEDEDTECWNMKMITTDSSWQLSRREDE